MTMHHPRLSPIEDRPPARFVRLRNRPAALPGPTTLLRTIGAAMVATSQAFSGRRKMRRDLLDLSDDRLRDIGITRDEALRAAERIAWRSDWT
ncbi:DUF1127 domain-containing protein [Jiella sp. MQZ9-1]|nr:DUF1127 domain-containing protein [Jiella flava]MCD2472316.1 DUF1127 domain-containing protein [Jiella flava]